MYFKGTTTTKSGNIYKSGKVYGYCDLGGIAQTDNGELAKEALVFIIVSLNKKFKCPVAYFFINKINATVGTEAISTCCHFSSVCSWNYSLISDKWWNNHKFKDL